MQLNMLEAMNIYVNVVEQGSFIRAAEVLELHRPAVTRAVQNLEHDLGVKLLHRTTRQVSMTDEGEEFYQRCLSLLSELDDVRRLFSSTQPPKGRLRLDVPITLARAVIIPALGEEGAIITSLFNELKASGIAIIYRDINPTPENTRLAEKAGADIIVATGFDEGGTLPGTALGTFSIVPLIADSVKSVPVMAAGGITDSRTARAAHALGAEGVFAGSVFIGTEESRVPQSVKDKIINANGLDLLLFRTLPDYYRSLPGKLADKLVSMDKAGASNEELAQTMGGLRGLRIGMLEGNTDEGYIALGTGIGNIRSIKSVAEVVNELAIC
ncbi:LysR family transcriptional regulator [Salmonella enterica]|nr:LysR family transcriptional regulator [Salmonella enterica]EBB5260890.1 LysR family transcriptional regulator [Salmonella enterica]